MKCINCGAELQEGARFCAFCGITLSHDDINNTTKSTEENVIKEEPIKQIESFEPISNDSIWNKIKTKINAAWNRLSSFNKVALIAMFCLVLLFLIAYFTNKTFAIVCSVIQLVGIVVAMLLRKGVIKTDKKWLSYVVLIVAIILTVLNVYSYFWGKKSTDVNNGNQSGIVSTDNSKPESKTALLPFGDDEYFDKKRDDIVNLLYQEGFYNIINKPISELKVEEIDRKGDITKITVDGSETFTKGIEFSKSVAIEITYYDAEHITVPIASKDSKTKDTEELVNLFKDGGFLNVSVEIKNDIDPEYSQETLRNEVSINSDSSFDTTDSFPFDAKVIITSHRPMEKYKVRINIDFLANLFKNKYSVDVEVSYKDLGTLSHGEDDSFELWLKPGKHTITFKKYSYKRPEKKVEFTIRGDTEITYQISCNEDSIHVEQTEFVDKGAVGEGEAMVPSSASDFKYDNYKDVEKALKEAGFTNIKTAILYDIVWGWTSEGEVDSVSVNGKKDFSKGSIFKKDAEIVITYHMWEEDDPNRKNQSETTKSESSKTENSSVSYSTNTKATVKNGNSGVYSYKSIGGTYSIYWIIDFDEGYVYYFPYGNGNGICDRVKIDYGDLNSYVKITYHDGSSVWSETLHFKYKNQPDHLIMQDHNGFEYDYYTTDLNAALKIKNSMKIVNY